MNIMGILRKSGRMGLADFANLFLPVSMIGREKDLPADDDSGDDCEGCEEDDEDTCLLCKFKGLTRIADQNTKASSEDKHSPTNKTAMQVFPFSFWAGFATSGGKVGR